MVALLEKYGRLVCKPNEGTGGRNVYKVNDVLELESATHKIFSKTRSMAVSPYCEIIKEYRVIVLSNEVKLIYSKNIPFILGDGKRSVRELVVEYISHNTAGNFSYSFDEETANCILKEGEIFKLNWKSNLGQGASPIILSHGDEYDTLSALALKATKALSMSFCSVDIVDTLKGLQVLEINNGVMMENFAQVNQDNYKTAKGIYKEAVEMMLK